METSTYNYPKDCVTINNLKLPTCLELGLIKLNSVRIIDNVDIYADYFEKDDGKVKKEFLHVFNRSFSILIRRINNILIKTNLRD